MSNIKYRAAWRLPSWQSTILSYSSAARFFPAKNIQRYNRSATWRTTGVNVTEHQVHDLGVDTDLNFAAAFGDFDSNTVLRLQANSVDDWAAPPVDEVMTHRADGIATLYLDQFVTHPYVRLVAVKPDAATVLNFGAWGFGQFYEFLRNPARGSLRQSPRHTDDVRMNRTGQSDATRGVGLRGIQLQMTQTPAAQVEELVAMDDYVGLSVPIIIDPDHTRNDLLYLPYYGRLLSPGVDVSDYKGAEGRRTVSFSVEENR